MCDHAPRMRAWSKGLLCTVVMLACTNRVDDAGRILISGWATYAGEVANGIVARICP